MPTNDPDFLDFSQLELLTSIMDWIRVCATLMERHQCFYGHGFDDAVTEARFLLLRSLELSIDVPDSLLSASLLESEKTYLYQLIKRRCLDKVPSAYLLEEAWFCHEPFWVTPMVLIPRSPISELIEHSFSRWLEQPPTRILDLCTGSGCIAIAMARMFPDAIIDASDISPDAIEIAVENVSAKGLSSQINIYQSDLFVDLPDQKYDLIVANPPYVDAVDLNAMPQEFFHEPRLGLEAGEDGLTIVHQLIQQSARYLSDDGWLVCEVGNSMEALCAAYPHLPFEWPEFEHGGHGVFVVSAQTLQSNAIYY